MTKNFLEENFKILDDSVCSNDTGIETWSYLESFVLSDSDLTKKKAAKYDPFNDFILMKNCIKAKNFGKKFSENHDFKLNHFRKEMLDKVSILRDQVELNQSSIKLKKKRIENQLSDQSVLKSFQKLANLGIKTKKSANINLFNQIVCDEYLKKKQRIGHYLYLDSAGLEKIDYSLPKIEFQKARTKKEFSDNEIDFIENHLVMKRNYPELYSLNIDSNSNISFENNKNMDNDDLVKITNERDFYQQKLNLELLQRDIENKELQNQLTKNQEELLNEKKSSKDKISKIEEDLKQTKYQLEKTTSEKEEFSCKIMNLEKKISSLQFEISRKESCGKEFMENTERHLTSLCQTLTVQLDDAKYQLKIAEEKVKRSEAELNSKNEKIDCYSNQIENLKKEIEQKSDSYQKMKRTYEEQLNCQLIKEKEMYEIKERITKEKDYEISDLKIQLADALNYKINNQEIQDALIDDFKRTITKQDEEIRACKESLKLKQSQLDSFQRESEHSIGLKIDEKIKKEKIQWEQEQNFIIKREILKVNEERMKEMARVQEELVIEKEKFIFEKNRATKLEKQIDELNQELKFSNKEKSIAIAKAKESVKNETENLKIELLNNKQEEINKYKKIINDLEEEMQRIKIEQYKNIEKNKELFSNAEKVEKELIKDINEEIRKLSSFLPGQHSKIATFSKNSLPIKNGENTFSFNTFQLAFNNLKIMLDEVSQIFQDLKNENEQIRRVNSRLIQDKDDELESIKKKFEKQKQKEFESIRNFVKKDHDFSKGYNSEINSLINSLKNKDKEIKEIQENMAEWKKETLTKLANKFEIELNRELDKRMKDYKDEATSHQNQLEKLRKEIDILIKECRQNNVHQISHEQHERMIKYLQSRLNDLRDENLVLRDRYKSTTLIQSNGGSSNYVSSLNDNEFQSRTNPFMIQNISKNPFLQDENLVSSMYSSSLDGDDNLESRNEILQQKLKELQKLQNQLDNVQS